MNKEKQVAYLTYYYNENNNRYSKVYATLNFQEVFEFRSKAKKAGIEHKVNFTWENISNKTDHYTVNSNIPKPPKIKVKRPNVWQQLENWLQS